MLKALDTYYHPANSGGHTKALHDFLDALTDTFVGRVHSERFSKRKKWWDVTKVECYLTDEDIAEFVSIVKPGMLLA